MQDHALPLGRDEKANRLDVGQRDFIKIQDRWNTTRGKFRAHMLDVFRPHAADQTNRGAVFADVGDDPECHVNCVEPARFQTGGRTSRTNRAESLQWPDR